MLLVINFILNLYKAMVDLLNYNIVPIKGIFDVLLMSIAPKAPPKSSRLSYDPKRLKLNQLDLESNSNFAQWFTGFLDGKGRFLYISRIIYLEKIGLGLTFLTVSLLMTPVIGYVEGTSLLMHYLIGPFSLIHFYIIKSLAAHAIIITVLAIRIPMLLVVAFTTLGL